MPLIIVDAPSEPFEYLSDNPLEMVLAWSVDTDALTNAFVAEGITSFGYLLNQLDFRVQVDSSTNFDTINLKEYTGETANDYHTGINVFAMDIPVPRRNYNSDLTYYWRARHELTGMSMSTLSDYCTYSEFSLNKNETIEITDAMHLAIPDENVYTKDEKSTNIYSLLKNFGNQIDLSKFENRRMKETLDIDVVRESALQDSFGTLLDLSKPDYMSYPEYRAVLRKLFDIYSNSGTKYALKEIIKAFTGVYPEIIECRDIYGELMYTDRRDPTISPFPTPPLPFDYKDPYAHFFPVNSLDPYDSELVPKCAPFSRAEKAFRIDIKVKNPFMLEFNNELIAAAVFKLKPAHVKIYLYIENAQGVMEIYSVEAYNYSKTFYVSELAESVIYSGVVEWYAEPTPDNIRAGVAVCNSVDGEHYVPFSSAFPNNHYAVSTAFENEGTGGYMIYISNKTVYGFVAKIRDVGSNPVDCSVTNISFSWQAVRTT